MGPHQRTNNTYNSLIDCKSGKTIMKILSKMKHGKQYTTKQILDLCQNNNILIENILLEQDKEGDFILPLIVLQNPDILDHVSALLHLKMKNSQSDNLLHVLAKTHDIDDKALNFLTEWILKSENAFQALSTEKNSSGLLPLEEAAKSGNVFIHKFFLEHGVNYGPQDFIFAIEEGGHSNIVDHFLKPLTDEQAVVDFFARSGSEIRYHSTNRIKIAHTNFQRALITAVDTNNRSTVDALLTLNIPIQWAGLPENEQSTDLTARLKSLNRLKLLDDMLAGVNYPRKNLLKILCEDSLRTAESGEILVWLAKKNDWDCVQQLLKKYSKAREAINERDPEGKTALFYAAQTGEYDVVSNLLKWATIKFYPSESMVGSLSEGATPEITHLLKQTYDHFEQLKKDLREKIQKYLTPHRSILGFILNWLLRPFQHFRKEATNLLRQLQDCSSWDEIEKACNTQYAEAIRRKKIKSYSRFTEIMVQCSHLLTERAATGPVPVQMGTHGQNGSDPLTNSLPQDTQSLAPVASTAAAIPSQQDSRREQPSLTEKPAVSDHLSPNQAAYLTAQNNETNSSNTLLINDKKASPLSRLSPGSFSPREHCCPPAYQYHLFPQSPWIHSSSLAPSPTDNSPVLSIAQANSQGRRSTCHF